MRLKQFLNSHENNVLYRVHLVHIYDFGLLEVNLALPILKCLAQFVMLVTSLLRFELKNITLPLNMCLMTTC